jgi:hypothetical protein
MYVRIDGLEDWARSEKLILYSPQEFARSPLVLSVCPLRRVKVLDV